MTRVVHCKVKPYDVYIGRGSKWGNPYSHKYGTTAKYHVGSIKEAIEKYAEWIQTQPQLLAALGELKGKTLGCWCAGYQVLTANDPTICHGQILAKLADKLE